MAVLIGKWVYCPELTTGFEEFHIALGSTPEEKEHWQNHVFTLDIARDGDNWQMVMGDDGFPSTTVQTFKSGEPVTFKFVDRKQNMRSTITVHSDKFTERMGVEHDDGSYKEWDIVTEREGEMLKMTHTCNGVVQVMKMKKI